MEPDQNRIKFFEYLSGEISNIEFEAWVYANKELENEFPKEDYIELISGSFKPINLKPFIVKWVNTFYDWREFENWRSIQLLKKIVNDKIEIVLASRQLRRLYDEQEDVLGSPLISTKLGIGFYSVFEDSPVESEYKNWNKKIFRGTIKNSCLL